jgi:hypothetical protein
MIQRYGAPKAMINAFAEPVLLIDIRTVK